MIFLNSKSILLIFFLSIGISKTLVESKAVEFTLSPTKNSINPGDLARIDSKIEYLSDSLDVLHARIEPLLNLNIDEKLNNLEKKINDNQNEKLNELEARLRKLISHNQRSIEDRQNEIAEKENEIRENSKEIKNVYDKLENVSGKVLLNSEKIQVSSNKLDLVINTASENSDKILDNSKKIGEKEKEINLVSNKATQNSEGILLVSAKVLELEKKNGSDKAGISKTEFETLKDQINLQLNANGLDIKDTVNKIKGINQELESSKNRLLENTKLINKNKEILKLATEDISKSKDIANQISIKINKPKSLAPFSEKIRTLKSLVYVWKISDVSKKMVGRKWSIESEVFALNGYGFGAQVKLSPSAFSSDELGISIRFRDILRTGPSLHLRPFPEVTYVVKEQGQGARGKDRVAPHSAQFNSSVALDEYVFYEYLMFKKRLFSAGFVKDDTLLVEVHVEPPEMAYQTQSLDGNVIASVDQLRHRIELAKDYLVWWSSSPYFYTHPLGYRVQVQLWLHYNDKIVPQILFLTGDHDQALPHSFPHKTTLTVFNFKDLTQNLVRTQSADFTDGTMYEIPGFTYDEVKDFLENDTLYYKVSIEPKS